VRRRRSPSTRRKSAPKRSPKAKTSAKKTLNTKTTPKIRKIVKPKTKAKKTVKTQRNIKIPKIIQKSTHKPKQAIPKPSKLPFKAKPSPPSQTPHSDTQKLSKSLLKSLKSHSPKTPKPSPPAPVSQSKPKPPITPTKKPPLAASKIPYDFDPKIHDVIDERIIMEEQPKLDSKKEMLESYFDEEVLLNYNERKIVEEAINRVTRQQNTANRMVNPAGGKTGIF